MPHKALHWRTEGDKLASLHLGHLTKLFPTEPHLEGRGPALHQRIDAGEKRSEQRFQIEMGRVGGGGMGWGISEVSRNLDLVLLIPFHILREKFKAKV